MALGGEVAISAVFRTALVAARRNTTEALAKQLRLVVSTSVEKFQDCKNVMVAPSNL